MGQTCNSNGDTKKYMKIFIYLFIYLLEKFLGKCPLGRQRMWGNIMKTNTKKIGFECERQLKITQDHTQRRVFVQVAMNLLGLPRERLLIIILIMTFCPHQKYGYGRDATNWDR
jgi:hypothetical protein